MKKVLTILAFIALSTVKMSFAQTKADVALNQVLISYYDLKNALASDKNNEAVEKAKVLSTKLAAVSVKTIPAAKQKLWLKESTLIKVNAKTLAATKDLKAQRKTFEGISNPMIKLLKGLQFNDATAYIQYCPMVKASWINEKENIENPYYGSEMFDCGGVKETIAKK